MDTILTIIMLQVGDLSFFVYEDNIDAGFNASMASIPLQTGSSAVSTNL